MIFRIVYEKSSKTEILIPWDDVWNGSYKKMLFGVFEYVNENHLDAPKITEYRHGLVWEISINVPLPEMPIVVSQVPKTKIKIGKVFEHYENFFTDGISTDVYTGTAENGET